MSHPDYPNLTVEEFRAKVQGHLARLGELLPNQLPADLFDPCIEEFADEFLVLDTFLHAFGADERQQERQETAVVQKREARRRAPALEEVVMMLDYQVQGVIELLGRDPKTWFLLAPMTTDMLLNSMVKLLDLMPIEGCKPDRLTPSGFPSERDPDVKAILNLMYQRKLRATT